MAETWTVLRVLRWTEDFFRDKGIAEPRLDAQVLLADLLRLDRVGLYLNFDRPLTAVELAAFRGRVGRRAHREPVQYIVGKAEFWSLSFRVTPAVLIPRPETELLVEEAVRLTPAATALLDLDAEIFQRFEVSGKLRRTPAVTAVLDVGTGSGALAVVLARELPSASVTAIDLAADALQIARQNAADNGVEERIAFLQADLAELPPGPFDLIVSNPPYIPSGELAGLMPEVRDFEPCLALDGGVDGLAAYRQLARQAASRLRTGGWLLVEIGVGQAEPVRELFLQSGLDEVFTRDDYAGMPRVVGGRKT